MTVLTKLLKGGEVFQKFTARIKTMTSLTKNLGSDWIILTNGYKPYACGIVQHPLIDAMITASKNTNIPHGEIEAVDALIHPHTITITGVEDHKQDLSRNLA